MTWTARAGPVLLAAELCQLACGHEPAAATGCSTTKPCRRALAGTRTQGRSANPSPGTAVPVLGKVNPGSRTRSNQVREQTASGAASFRCAKCGELAGVARVARAGTTVDMGPSLGRQDHDGLVVDYFLGTAWHAATSGAGRPAALSVEAAERTQCPGGPQDQVAAPCPGRTWEPVRFKRCNFPSVHRAAW
jgi:hypothetical protein